MKYAIIIMDGAADEPLTQLDNKTVLQSANIPNTDWISINGRQGLTRTIPEGFTPGSDVALMSVLGYDPAVYYTGRAPLEAVARNIHPDPTDWIFRCNLVTIADGIMKDYSAGHIDTVQAARLINDLDDHFKSDRISFYPGISYRHLMVHRGGPFNSELTPPHDILDEPVSKHLPRGRNGKELCQIMEDAAEFLAQHEVNKIRRDLDENPATGIWLWGQGRQPRMDTFRSRFGISAAVITAVDLLGGLGKLIGMDVIPVEGATGYIDTDYAAKGRAAVEALANHDLVFVHVEAPDEAGHGAMVEAKVEAVEQIDLHIVGPLLEKLRQTDAWRIMVLPDHPTPIRLRTHSPEPVPFALAGTGVSANLRQSYCEANAKKSGFRIDQGHLLMEYFIKAKG